MATAQPSPDGMMAAADGGTQMTNYVSMEMGQGPPRSDEEDDDNNTVSHSIVESVMTAEGIHDVSGFFCVCFVILIGDMSRGVMFPTLWPLVESLGGTQINLGYSVAAFSFGRIVASPVFGGWSHQYGYTKTLLVASGILLIGTLTYAQIQNVGDVHFLIVAQTILGLGSGTLGVTRAFVADVTAKRERTTYMAWITAVQYAGFTVTPFFGSLFSKILGDSEYRYGILLLNMYTAPAYFMTFIVISTLILLSTVFKNRHRLVTAKDPKKKSQKRQAIDQVANAQTIIGLTIFDCCILGCMLLNVSTKGSIASFETLGVAIADSHFGLVDSQAGVIVSLCGMVGVASLLSMGHLAKYLTDVQLILSGMGVMAVGIASLSTIHDDVVNPLWRYCTAIFLIYGIGYPIGHTAVIGLFSKIVGRRPQGVLLGWFASAGSAARMAYPIMSGYLATYTGIQFLFCVLTGILSVSMAFVLWSRSTLGLLSS